MFEATNTRKSLFELSFQRDIESIIAGDFSSRQYLRNRKMKTHISDYKQETERDLEMVKIFKHSKACLQ